MRKKKHHHEEHEEHVNHEAWVIPYADMLTLLMAMFLVLWAIGQVDVDKAKAVSTGFADQMGMASAPGEGAGAGGKGVLDGSDSAKPPPIVETKLSDEELRMAAEAREEARETEREQLAEVETAINETAEQAGMANAVKFRTEDRGLVVSIVAEGVLFDAGSAALEPAGRVVLDSIATALAGLPNQVSIEGHTDNVPIATAQFPSNWELSTARASSVLRYLADLHGVPQDRLGAAGYADRRPVASNDTTGGRAQNRRVDIAVIALYPGSTGASTDQGSTKEKGSR